MATGVLTRSDGTTRHQFCVFDGGFSPARPTPADPRVDQICARLGDARGQHRLVEHAMHRLPASDSDVAVPIVNDRGVTVSALPRAAHQAPQDAWNRRAVDYRSRLNVPRCAATVDVA